MTTIHDIVLGAAKSGRACGDCVACCQVLNIDEPDMIKPAGQLCMHCTGKGCSIYDSRPGVCRTWDCVWRRIESMPPETRPDRLGVVFAIDRQAEPRNPFDRLYFVARATGAPEALHSRPTGDVAAMLAHGPLPIFASWGAERQMIYPRVELAAAIVDPQGPHDPALAAEGEAWMAKYEPFARLADEVARKGSPQAVR
ncbi:MAG: hypothetical protein WDN45_00190 [Caulobacteraceae bacterium]